MALFVSTEIDGDTPDTGRSLSLFDAVEPLPVLLKQIGPGLFVFSELYALRLDIDGR